jgi:hypothetical protein
MAIHLCRSVAKIGKHPPLAEAENAGSVHQPLHVPTQYFHLLFTRNARVSKRHAVLSRRLSILLHRLYLRDTKQTSSDAQSEGWVLVCFARCPNYETSPLTLCQKLYTEGEATRI